MPADRRASDSSHYSPYPPTPSHHHFTQPALPSRPSLPRLSMDDSIEDDQPQYKVARAISSCTRCRSRKQKCDGKLPACSACEKAKVECIGFDAISKTNVSRNHLYSLEQEVASLRAQVAALTSGNTDTVGAVKRSVAASAAQAVASYSHARASDLMIDPALVHEGAEPSLRSPWMDSPTYPVPRRASEVSFPPLSMGDSPKSPYSAHRSYGQPTSVHATSLTRMVHDAALRTGHAMNYASVLNPPGPSSVNGTSSDRGSVESPVGEGHDLSTASPGDILTPRSGIASSRRAPPASPLVGSASASVSVGKSKRREFCIPPLPPPQAAERLVAAYVDFVGVTAPIIHIPSLGKQLIKIRERRDVEESDVFVVMMVLALSTMASSRFVESPDDLRKCSEAFHAEAMKHLDAVFEEQTYVGLQAILLLVWYSLLNPEKGSIWFLVGLATRTCVDLGFHNEHNSQVEQQADVLEVDMRRRLFWCTYKMDRLLSQSLGRPPSIPDGFINVPMPSSVHDVDIHPGQYGPLVGDPCSYKAVFIHTTRLRQLQSEILTYTYGMHASVGISPTAPPAEWFDDCFERLKSWLANAPEPRGTVSTEGYAISFHNSALLLFRPSPGNPRPARSALATVLASSSYIIRIYHRMQVNNRISWFWMTSHFSFMAGLSFLYAFFNLYSFGGPSVPTLEEAMADIESCLGVLEFLTARVPSAGACHDTMQSLSKAIFDQISASPPPIPTSNNSSPRGILRGMPISSSRDDPHPNEAFPAPLPPVTLPYELSLLDNLFINPMAAHNKASDYTKGNKNKSRASDVRAAFNSAPDPTIASITSGNFGALGPPQGFPPGVFQSGLSGLGAYGVAAQVNNTHDVKPQLTPIFDGNGLGNTNAMYGDMAMTNQTPMGGSGVGNGNGNVNGLMNPGGGGVGEGDFDIFSFLMDEEGGLGGSGNWDALEVPADFSLWS